VFVYAFENHPEFGPACRSLLSSIQIGSTLAIASTLVLGELLVRPFRDNRPDIARGYTELLAAYPNLEQVPADASICESAAQLRAQWPALRLPDAIHIATALSKRATAFVSSDKHLPAVAELTILRPA
jgi:predicted nucleic acid-binding protein